MTEERDLTVEELDGLEANLDSKPAPEDYLAAHERWVIRTLVRMARRAPRWIPVTERMPEIGEWVLVASAGSSDGWLAGRGLAHRDPEAGGAWTGNTSFVITHWMPLPEGPR